MWQPLVVLVGWLYEHFFLLLPLPHPLQAAYLSNPGVTWLTIALLFRLWYLVPWWRRQHKSDDLATPHAGTPGEPYYENVRQRFADYQAAFQRWEPQIRLNFPIWRYYKRLATDQPDIIWRGRVLIIEKSLLERDRLQDLQPALARELMYYQCDDVALRDILAYYELSTEGCQQLWFNVFGLYVSWPIRWINTIAWPGYWDDRVEVADEFAFGVGQGYLLYTQIDEQIRQEEALKAERGVLAREIAHLKERLNVFQERATIRDWTVPGEDRPQSNYARSTDGYTLGLTDDYGQGHFMKKWNELRQHLKELRGRDHQLEQLEATFRVTHPMLEERRGLLAAHLGSEQTWRERQGIASPDQLAAFPGAQKLSGLASGTGRSTQA